MSRKNPWLQLFPLLLALSLVSCTRQFVRVIDPSIVPTTQQLPGLDGAATPRPVAVVVGPGESRNEFVVGEIVVHEEDPARLAALLSKYHGVVVRDGTPPRIPGLDPRGAPQPSGDYLIRVDLANLTVNDLVANMEAARVLGSYRFSSPEAEKMVALAVRERAQRVGLNFLLRPAQPVIEGPNASFGPDASKWPWMGTGPGTLNIGVMQAWNYLLYKGFPPTSGPYHPPIIAVIDAGFDLDASGKPNNGNIDYHFFGSAPLQFDMISHTQSAGGENPGNCGTPCPWHGQEVFGVAAAYPRNQFGIAGTGGEGVLPLLLKIDYTSYLAGDAVRAAAFHGAAVANMSFGGECANDFCRAFDFGWADSLQNSITLANSWGTVTVAAAGNAGQSDNGQWDNIPCTLNNVVCVGAIKPMPPAVSESYSGAGSRVSIWAPDCVLTTPIEPDTAQSGQFCGTSAASPFVAGIVAQLKALNPYLFATDVISILQANALPSSDPRVIPGYVDAFHAVRATSPIQPLTLKIVEPTVPSVPWGKVHLASNVNDPHQPGSLSGLTIQWLSNRDGALCTGLDCTATLITVGPHTITATVTNQFGDKGGQSIPLTVIDQPPVVTIFNPMSGATFAAGAPINLRGTGKSPSEVLNDTQLAWSSSIAGAMKAGRSVFVSPPAGTQTITLTATDSKGGTGNASVVVNVVAGLDTPSVIIQAPTPDPDTNYIDFGTGQLITFQGQATDPVDGALPGTSLQWSSDVDGPLGTGNTIQAKLSGGPCYVNLHKVTLKATNNAGNSAAAVVQVGVGNIC